MKKVNRLELEMRKRIIKNSLISWMDYLPKKRKDKK